MMMDVYKQAETCCSKTFQHNWVTIYDFFPCISFLEPKLDVPNKTNFIFGTASLYMCLPPPPPRKT